MIAIEHGVMPATFMLATLLATLLNVIAVLLNHRLVLLADFLFLRRLRPAVALRKRCEALTLADVWAETCARSGDKACLVCAASSRSFSFLTVDRESNRVARWAIHVGGDVGKQLNVVVGLLMSSSPEFVIIFLGLVKSGAAVALIDTDLTSAQLLDALRITRCTALVFGANFAPVVREVADELKAANLSLHVWAPEEPEGKSAGHFAQSMAQALAAMTTAPIDRLNRRTAIAPTDVCALVCSARVCEDGTGTGADKSKACVQALTHARLIDLAGTSAAACRLTHSDCVYAPVACGGYAGCTLAIGSCVLAGATLVLPAEFSASVFWQDCADLACTLALVEGSMGALLAAQPKSPAETAHGVRALVTCALGGGGGRGRRIDGKAVSNVCLLRFEVPTLFTLYAPHGLGGQGGRAGERQEPVQLFCCEHSWHRSGKAKGLGSAGCAGWLQQRAGGFAIIPLEPAGRNPAGLCSLAERGAAGELLVRVSGAPAAGAQSAAADEEADARSLSGSPVELVRSVLEQGDVFARTGDAVVHERFGGWLRLVGRVPQPLRTLEAERAIVGVGGVCDAIASIESVGAAAGPVCVLAVVTAAGQSPELDAVSEAYAQAVPAGHRSACLLRLARGGFAHTSACTPRVRSGGSVDELWSWDDKAGRFHAPLDAEASAKMIAEMRPLGSST